jgi:hypothetical protein
MHTIGTAAEPSSELSAEKSAREVRCTVPTGRPRFGHPIGNPQIHHMFDRFELIDSGYIARDVCLTYVVCPEGKRGVTNTLAMPIDKILYIYLLRPHSLNTTKKSVPI